MRRSPRVWRPTLRVSCRLAVAGKTAFVHAPTSRTAVLVLPTDEERVILDEVVAHLES